MAERRKMSGLTRFYVPFARVDEENRTVEGYCYTQGQVKSDQWNLKRSTLEAAAPGYLEFPAVREMHQQIAAGKADAVSFDEKGCVIRVKVVDDQAWEKVKAEVYRGFSIGGRPTLVRGKDIERFDWLETSLVDRPADPGAVFTVVRSEQADAEYEVEVLPEAVERADDAAEDAESVERLDSDDVPARENLEGPKSTTHYDCGRSAGCCGHFTRGGAQECMVRREADRQAILASMQEHMDRVRTQRADGTDGLPESVERLLERVAQFRADLAADAWTEGTPEAELAAAVIRGTVEYLQGLPGPLPAAERAEVPDLERLQADHDDLLQRFTTLESERDDAQRELAVVRGELTSAKELADKLSREPAPSKAVRYPAALERTFAANQDLQPAEVTQLQAEWAELSRSHPETEAEQRQTVIRMQEVKQQLSSLGAPPARP